MQGLVPWDQYRTEAERSAPEVTLVKHLGDQART
jgi:hypothetical protein